MPTCGQRRFCGYRCFMNEELVQVHDPLESDKVTKILLITHYVVESGGLAPRILKLGI